MNVIRHIRIEKGEVHTGGQLEFSHREGGFNQFAKALYKHYAVVYPKFYKMSPLSKLGFLASELLLKDLDLSGVDPEKVSLIIANSSSSLHTDSIYQDSLEEKPSPAIFVYTLPNILIGEICIRNGFRGEGIFFLQKEFDKPFLVDYAAALIRDDSAAMSLVGWIEMDMNGKYLADLSLLK